MHRYTYVHNNPVQFVDPRGASAEIDIDPLTMIARMFAYVSFGVRQLVEGLVHFVTHTLPVVLTGAKVAAEFFYHAIEFAFIVVLFDVGIVLWEVGKILSSPDATTNDVQLALVVGMFVISFAILIGVLLFFPEPGLSKLGGILLGLMFFATVEALRVFYLAPILKRLYPNEEHSADPWGIEVYS